MAHEIVSGGKCMLLMPYANDWRRQRKMMMHRVLGVSQKALFKPFQDLESRTLMLQLM